jgi:POT family proton-dependent oligopeptide transporter
MPYPQRTSLLLIAIIELLERFSYYGTRAIIVLFAIDENGLGLQRSEALSSYAQLTFLVFLLPLPAGIISDLTIKQKNGTLLGGVIALAGYTSLSMEEMNFVVIGLILMAIGTSFVKTNLTVLVGRLFEKTDKNRDFGFMLFYFGINLGAFIGVLVIGSISEEMGWKYGFMISAIATLLYVVLFYFIKDQLPLIEKNINQKYLETSTFNDTIIDSELAQNKKLPNPAPVFLIVIFTIIISLFWNLYEISSSPFYYYLSQKEDFTIMGFYIPISMMQTIGAVFNLIIMFVFLLTWYFQGLGSTIGKIALSMILLGVSIQVMYYVITFSGSNYMSYALLATFLFSTAEVLIAPFVMSYITRLSDVRYSSTIFGFYLLCSGVAAKFLYYFVDIDESTNHMMVLSIIAILIGVSLILFRKKILKMSGGLD